MTWSVPGDSAWAGWITPPTPPVTPIPVTPTSTHDRLQDPVGDLLQPHPRKPATLPPTWGHPCGPPLPTATHTGENIPGGLAPTLHTLDRFFSSPTSLRPPVLK